MSEKKSTKIATYFLKFDGVPVGTLVPKQMHKIEEQRATGALVKNQGLPGLKQNPEHTPMGGSQ